MWCWGEAIYGMVDGTPQSPATPKRVPLSRSALAVTAGGFFTCAILDDNTVACWGKSSRGQLGNGVAGSEGLFEGILDQVTSVSAGRSHVCAVRAGIVWCWGSNERQQLGDNGSVTDAIVPQPTPGIAASSVVAGVAHSCALDGGRYRCWGSNDDQQLGLDVVSSGTPTPASALTDIVALRAGAYHTCAIRSDATLWCWGNNTLGALGDGTAIGTDVRIATPTQAVIGPIVDAVAGDLHTCATEREGTVRCWGLGTSGQVADATRMSSNRPLLVPLPGTPVGLNAGGRSACAIVDSGQRALYCWGTMTTLSSPFRPEPRLERRPIRRCVTSAT